MAYFDFIKDQIEVAKKPETDEDSRRHRKEVIEMNVKKFRDMVEHITESDDFEPIRMSFEIHDKRLVADRYWLEIEKLTVVYVGELKLSLMADKDKTEHTVSIIIEICPRQQMLDKLNELAMIEKINDNVSRLSYHLEDL